MKTEEQEPSYTLPIYSPTPSSNPDQLLQQLQSDHNSVQQRKMGVLNLTVTTSTDKASESASKRNPPATTVPRWRTKEFYVYYVVLAIVLPIMAWIPASLSRRERHIS